MPSNHISNEPYHEWLRKEAKKKEFEDLQKEMTIPDEVDTILKGIVKLQADRDELAAMLASALGNKRNLTKFIDDWHKSKRS